jgi:hypothetical protein
MELWIYMAESVSASQASVADQKLRSNGLEDMDFKQKKDVEHKTKKNVGRLNRREGSWPRASAEVKVKGKEGKRRTRRGPERVGSGV